MTALDWVNVAQCARARREGENLSAWWCSHDRPRFDELMAAECALLGKMVFAHLATQR